MSALKDAAKFLIRDLAKSHKLKPSQVLGILKYSREQTSRSGVVVFASVLHAHRTNLYPKTIARFLNGKRAFALKASQIDKVAPELSQSNDQRYTFAYDFISNFYLDKLDKLSTSMKFSHVDGAVASTLASPIRQDLDKFVNDINNKSDLLPTKKAKEPVDSAPSIDLNLTEDEKTKYAGIRKVKQQPKLAAPVDFSKIKWGLQQAQALNMIYKWLRNKNRDQIFRLFGYAGAGKTFLAKAVAEFAKNENGKKNVPTGDVLFAAYTGQAAAVMRRNGCFGATTLHSLLYKPVVDPHTGRCVGFTLNPESPLAHAALLIVDEVSMVSAEMAADIEYFGCPILCLGDPGQLPPIEGYGYFTASKPDYFITDIQRQAKDNPIIALAAMAREGKELKVGRYGSSRVIRKPYISAETYAKYNQIIVGRNDTRKAINVKMRKHYGYYDKSPFYPTEGERLVCLKNNKTKGLYNGTTWRIGPPSMRKVMVPKFKNARVHVEGKSPVLAFTCFSEDEVNEDGSQFQVDTQCGLYMFNSGLEEPPFYESMHCDQFDYCDAMTAHKMQGSQAPRIFIIDESAIFRENAWKHLYTSITRAIDSVTINLPIE